MVEVTVAATVDEFVARVEALEIEAGRYHRFVVVMPHGFVPLAQQADDGDEDARRIVSTWIKMRKHITGLPRGHRMPCTCCGTKSLKPRAFSFCLVLPLAVEQPSQGVAFGVCEVCGPDQAGADAAARQSIGRVWPEARHLGSISEAGHA